MKEISVRNYCDRRLDDLDKRYSELRKADQVAVNAALAAAEKAVSTAKVASDEHLKMHNGVLEEMKEDRVNFSRGDVVEEHREQDDTRFKRLESFQAKMLGGMVVLGAIGLGNLIKLWLA